MEFDYFSIDAILAENQKLQCNFNREILGMGHLGGGSERDIVMGSKIQLPYWLANTILLSTWADINIPAPFGARVRNALLADARSVRLSGLVGAGGLWYGFGKSIMDMVLDEQANELSKMLRVTFRDRLVEIIDQAQHFAALGPAGGSGSTGDTAQAFREGLDASEREIFALAQESAKRTKRWYEDSDKPRR
ncbi:hypothetical protein BDZ94DRAFT_1244953 [Collybia nuda]|uniref:DNA replication complex GINS protein PSF3 n=1 Tax=Collybia nuda TaxID=64659 RepID=A0A9P5YJE7_9AGAR|nr:hypothetical protein BDZ94DRAFT_1244953 [Collybia nuda]